METQRGTPTGIMMMIFPYRVKKTETAGPKVKDKPVMNERTFQAWILEEW
jgi:hypothetical protein